MNPKFSSAAGYLKSIRIGNLCILGASQILAWVFLFQQEPIEVSQFFQSGIIPLVWSTILVAAGGYVINDYHDVKIDLINKPEKVVVGSMFSKRSALVWYGFLTGLGILLGLLVSFKIGLIASLASFLLWIYSVKLKRMAFWGNLTISFLAALTILELNIPYGWDSLFPYLFAGISFSIMLIREIVKDLEDLEGDEREDCLTLPILYGTLWTKRLLILLFLLFIGELIGLGLAMQSLAAWTLLGLLGGGSIFLMVQLQKADTRAAYARISFYSKWIMVCGVLSMIFAP